MQRPSGIGAEITIESLETADAALHELGWLKQEYEKLKAGLKQQIEALKERLAKACELVIDGQPTTFEARIAALTAVLTEWTDANIREHLVGTRKSKVLSHGELGLRQQPRVVTLATDDEGTEYSDEQVLGWIRESGLTKSQKAALLEIKTTLHLTGAKKAFEAGKLTHDDLESVGLVVREAFDAAFATPAKIAVTTE